MATETRDLYYSNECDFSNQLLQEKGSTLNNGFSLINVDDYYLQYGEFPPNLRSHTFSFY